jgi:hypothetical protein
MAEVLGEFTAIDKAETSRQRPSILPNRIGALTTFFREQCFRETTVERPVQQENESHFKLLLHAD